MWLSVHFNIPEIMKKTYLLAVILLALAAVTASARSHATIAQVFKEIQAIKGFQTTSIDKNSDYGYPDDFGFGVATGYGNSGPRKEFEKKLSKLPDEWILFNKSDNANLFKVYVERTDVDAVSLLIAMAGTGGADIIAVWFPDVPAEALNSFMNRHNRRE